jgi:hypothetical protein
MVFERNNTRTARRAPDEKVRVSDNLDVVLWNTGDIPGRENRIHLAFERRLKDGRCVRTWLPQQLLEVPEAVALVASALAKPGVGHLSDDLRRSLARLSELLRNVQSELATAGSSERILTEGNGETIFG